MKNYIILFITFLIPLISFSQLKSVTIATDSLVLMINSDSNKENISLNLINLSGSMCLAINYTYLEPQITIGEKLDTVVYIDNYSNELDVIRIRMLPPSDTLSVSFNYNEIYSNLSKGDKVLNIFGTDLFCKIGYLWLKSDDYLNLKDELDEDFSIIRDGCFFYNECKKIDLKLNDE